MNHPSISNAEWEIMNVLWQQSPLTANAIVAALAHKEWSPQTVRTLVTRLVNKRALEFQKSGRAHMYFPAIDRDDRIRHERGSFVRRVYDGAVTPMLANFIEDEDLSPEDLQLLRKLLDDKERESS